MKRIVIVILLSFSLQALTGLSAKIDFEKKLDGAGYRAPRLARGRRPWRAAQRDVRQRRRTHHRDNGATSRAVRPREGVYHRIDHRQRLARVWVGGAGRRSTARCPIVQQDGRRHGHDHATVGNDLLDHTGHVSRRGRRNGRAERT